MPRRLDELSVVGDGLLELSAAGVGCLQPVAPEHLRRLRQPEALTGNRLTHLLLRIHALDRLDNRGSQ